MSDKFDYDNFPYIYEQYLSENGNFEKLLRGLMEIKANHIGEAIKTAISDCFDLKTAKGNALDLWGRLLNVSRFLPETLSSEYQGDTNYQTLSDDDYRTLLVWTYQSQNFNITIPNLQQWLNGYFKMGAFVEDKNIINPIDNQNMSLKVYFSDQISKFIEWALVSYDLIPRPSGVLSDLIAITSKIWGFEITDNPTANRDYRTNFYMGQFAPIGYTPLPYRELPYLGFLTESGGGNIPFIDTGLILDSEYEFEVVGFMPDGKFGSLVIGFADNNSRQGNIFYNAGNKRTAGFWRVNSQGQGYIEHPFPTINFSNEFHYILNKHLITITQGANSETYQFEAQISNQTNANANILLFKYASATGNGGFIKSVKIRKNGDLLRDFIAVYRNIDGVLCFYDKVTEAFFENQGGGEFIEP